MKSLEKLDKFNHGISGILEWVGLAALVGMMLITTIDVIGAKLFLAPVFGSIDFMMLGQLVAMSFAAASTLLIGRHIQVEFFVPIFPKAVQSVINYIVNILCFFLFVVIAWRLAVYGHDLQTGGEVSPTARTPLYPFAYGAALACIPVALIYLSQILKSTLKAPDHES